MIDKLLTIGKAAEYLNISLDSLRRWDKSGKLLAKKSANGHRYYSQSDLDLFKQDVFALATSWVLDAPSVPRQEFYCPTSSEFKGRLSKLQTALEKVDKLKEYYPLIVAIVGEIGNNSFDHNLGNWSDISGVYFSYDINKGQVALADRGQGVFHTLKRVKPSIKNDEDALLTAFTEKISGRAPESRGNGLKLVLQVVLEKHIQLEFYSGGAELTVTREDTELHIQKTDSYFRGCLALIKF